MKAVSGLLLAGPLPGAMGDLAVELMQVLHDAGRV